MIAAITTVKDEADIIGCTVRHMLAQGVDHVWVVDWYSTDGTREILAEIDSVTVTDGEPLPFYWAHQPNYLYKLSEMAGAVGADWVIPFDADEYWTGTHDQTVKQALSGVPVFVDRVHAEIRQYVDFDHLNLREYPWTKVAYRYRPGVTLVAGNHFILGGYGPPDRDTLLVHELKFRNFDQFMSKVRRQVPWQPDSFTQPGAEVAHLAVSGGIHLRSDSSDEELHKYWDWLHEEIEDTPVPSEFRP